MAAIRPGYKITALQGITDLTVIAEVKEGFIDKAFEAETQVFRLQAVLTALNAFRKAARESLPHPSPFADAIAQFHSIHFFRFAILPPTRSGPPPHQGPFRLFLNVTFDGGWEPYIRLIWWPLGTLLDLIYCHCDGYPLACQRPFEDYVAWVRSHEVPSAFFYADSGVTAADQQYLEQFEATQRVKGERADADARCTRLALPGQPGPVAPTMFGVQTALGVLDVLARLRPLFPANGDDDAGVLLRFTRDLLRPFRTWIEEGIFEPGHRFDQLRAGWADQLAWLMSVPKPRCDPEPDHQAFEPARVQAGIAAALPFGSVVVHGALVLLRITDAAQARAWLANASVTRGACGPLPDPVVGVALTYNGMKALGLPQDTLDRLPHEFVEGMEARAGTLGDLRGNHPQAWKRPTANWPPGTPSGPQVELSSVHVLLQLRTPERPREAGSTGAVLLPRLVAEIDTRLAASGMQVLTVQQMRQVPGPSGTSTNHFGFADGISQPTLSRPSPVPAFWDDQVKTGELFLGYRNDRSDGPGARDDFLNDGSFLVVRKLRQYAERLDKVVQDATVRLAPDSKQEQARLQEVFLSKMLGRHTDGTPLIKGGPGRNDFDYRNDADGSTCPFAAHIRRANAREARPQALPPRIARRGMSYGTRPDAATATQEPDYGLVFMAYNASIAEQFEVIQRWIAGGNATGVSSQQADPFLGVPETGRPRVFRFLDQGRVLRLDLGTHPFVELQWGLYAFAPSIAALKKIGDLTPVPYRPALPPAPAARHGSEPEWRRQLEDGFARGPAWAAVREVPSGVLDTEYGALVGSCPAVMEVLKDDGRRFSVKGYGERMKGSIGLGYLGQDDAGQHRGHEQPYVRQVNQAIESVTEEQAYVAAVVAGRMTLSQLLEAAPGPDGQRTVTVDLAQYAGAVVTGLCQMWFGLPDGEFVRIGARSDKPGAGVVLPGHWLSVSRYVFSPHPDDTVRDLACPQGQNALQAVTQFLASNKPKGALTQAIVAAIPRDASLQARTVAGVILGMPATVIGNLVTVLMSWAGDRSLWNHQQDVLPLSTPPNPPGYGDASAALREHLLDTMAAAPVPYMDWRTVAENTTLGGVSLQQGQTLIVGLASAMQEARPGSRLMFGGSTVPNDPEQTRHACPGYAMAVGAMVGSIVALLLAGTLRPTDDPTQLTLIG